MYNEVLAEIHSRWFSFVCEAAASHIQSVAAHLAPYQLLDLGCGDGRLIALLGEQVASAYGIDISEAMIARAKQLVPRVSFEVADIFMADFPPANIVTMLGEILSYASSREAYSFETIEHLFQRIHTCLATGGLLLFDVLRSDFDYSGVFFHDQEEYTVMSRVTEETSIVTRSIISFLKDGDLYKKSLEVHQLRTFVPNDLALLLEKIGFSVRHIHGYGDFGMLPGRVGFECVKIA